MLGAVGFFYIRLTTNLPRNLPVKNSVKIWQNYGQESVAPLFLAHRVRYIEVENISLTAVGLRSGATVVPLRIQQLFDQIRRSPVQQTQPITAAISQ